MFIHISFLTEGVGATGSLVAFPDRCTNSCDDRYFGTEGVIRPNFSLRERVLNKKKLDSLAFVQ
jgi:hypothetical protein